MFARLEALLYQLDLLSQLKYKTITIFDCQFKFFFVLKVLGILGMQDRSETDWKVVVMNLEEAGKRNIENVNDLNRIHPGLSDTIRNYFKIYKVPSGKPENVFAYDGAFRDVDFSINVIR